MAVSSKEDIKDFLNRTLPSSITGVLPEQEKNKEIIKKDMSIDALNFGLSTSEEDVEEPKVIHQTIEDIIGDYTNITTVVRKDLSQEYERLLYRDDDTLRIIINDIEYFTRLKDECVQETDTDFVSEISMLENVRVLSEGILRNSGMFYSENLPWLLNQYPYLKNTTITSVVNAVYEDKHVYPICLPDGKVFTHMSYDVDSLASKLGISQSTSGLAMYDKAIAPKYQIASQLWVQQNNIIANLESLSQYPGCCVYVVEGYFDSKRINDQWNKKSVALLSSQLSRNKLTILKTIKSQGHCLVYVPDSDEAGLNEKLIKNPIWDIVYKIPKTSDNLIEYKDIDNYVKYMYLKSNNLSEDKIDMRCNLVERHRLNIPFHEEGLREKMIARKNKGVF